MNLDAYPLTVLPKLVRLEAMEAKKPPPCFLSSEAISLKP